MKHVAKNGFIKMSYITLTICDNFANKWANIVQFNEIERENQNDIARIKNKIT